MPFNDQVDLFSKALGKEQNICQSKFLYSKPKYVAQQLQLRDAKDSIECH